MIGVTIAIGPDWKEVAQLASDRMTSFTGLKCHIVDDWHGVPYEHPSWVKCRLLDIFRNEDSILYFDSDIWCMKPWKPDKIFEGCNRDFMAVPAVDNKYIQDECKRFNLPQGGKYITAGLLLFGREHREVFRYAESLHPRYGSWYDQTPINVALNQGVSVTRLPMKYSAETHGGNYAACFTGEPVEQVVNFHFCSCGGDAAKVKSLQEKGPTNV